VLEAGPVEGAEGGLGEVKLGKRGGVQARAQ
jgi:hypothetical protein